MSRKIYKKNVSEFLTGDFPENLLPITKLKKNKYTSKILGFCKQLKKAEQRLKKSTNTSSFSSFKPNLERNLLVPFSGCSQSSESTFSFSQGKQEDGIQTKPSLPVSLSVVPRKVLTQKKLLFFFSPKQFKTQFLKRQTRSSEFKKQLKERKKLSILYGNLSKKTIQKVFYKTKKLSGGSLNWFRLLESRLDVVLFRICFFKSIKSAQYWITRKKIEVNGKIVTISSFCLTAGDIISIRTRGSSKPGFSLVEKNTHPSDSLEQFSKNFNKIQLQSFFSKLLKPFDDFEKTFSNKNKLKKNTLSLKNLEFLSNCLQNSIKNIPFHLWVQAIDLLKKNTNGRKLPRWFVNYLKIKSQIGFEVLYQIKQKILLPSTFFYDKLRLLRCLKKLESIFYKNYTDFLVSIKLKNIFKQKPSHHQFSRNRVRAGFSPWTASHVECSYKNFTAIVLFFPQKITLPVFLDFDLISKSFK
jgi:ribosomal protein S4